MSVGENIRRYRKSRGMTQAQLAEAVGLTEGAVRHYESGIRAVKPELLESISAALGVVLGGVDFYPNKKLRSITNVTRTFYDRWGEDKYRHYLQLFALDETKKVSQLSSGMRVKYMLALALSHDARLLILDEPTSGLDPVSRDELMELFRGVVKSGERSILFSTHITFDLEKCASHITMIKDGQILCSDTRDGFLARYRAQFGDGQMSLEDILVRVERRSYDSEDFL